MNRICSNANKIIELYCELELGRDLEPKLTKIYPINYKDDDNILKNISDFAFPSIAQKYRGDEDRQNSPQSFSFVLVNEVMKFGFCRNEKISSSANKALVILSFYPWHDIFLKFINVLADLRKKVHEKDFDLYLNQILQKKVPEEHSLINLTFSSNGIILHEFIFKRPLQRQLSSIPENHNLNLFYNYIESRTMIEIFAALLAERRIIFVSNNLDKLSSCLQASCSLLYPMYWQHIFIPILPFKLKDYLLAPIPYCVGCPTSVFNTVRQEEIGDVVVINCDTNNVINPFNDMTETIPQDIVNFLKKNLSNSSVDLRGDRIPRIFLMSLVQLIGTYRDAIFYHDTKLKFSNEHFIEGQTQQYKPFIQKIVQLQIFQQFVEERLKLIESNSELTDDFEIEIELYAAKTGKKIKNYKELIRNFKGIANPVVKNAFKSVKATCKELKFKMRDKSDKYDYHQNTFSNSKISSKDRIDSCQSVFVVDTPSAASSSSTSSSSSSSPASGNESQMNILQELEGILNCSVSTAGSTAKENKEQEECNLIDLNDSPMDKQPVNNPTNNINNNPFGNSDLLSDVLSELNKTTNLDRSNWTKFD